MLGSRALPDLIYDHVRERILSGELPPGSPVRQDALAGALGVSKIPVREALARLESDGLVQCNPRRGFEVPPLTAAEAEEVFELRLQVEPAAGGPGRDPASDADRQHAYAALAGARRLDPRGRARALGPQPRLPPGPGARRPAGR